MLQVWSNGIVEAITPAIVKDFNTRFGTSYNLFQLQDAFSPHAQELESVGTTKPTRANTVKAPGSEKPQGMLQRLFSMKQAKRE